MRKMVQRPDSVCCSRVFQLNIGRWASFSRVSCARWSGTSWGGGGLEVICPCKVKVTQRRLSRLTVVFGPDCEAPWTNSVMDWNNGDGWWKLSHCRFYLETKPIRRKWPYLSKVHAYWVNWCDIMCHTLISVYSQRYCNAGSAGRQG